MKDENTHQIEHPCGEGSAGSVTDKPLGGGQ
ncbi:hypothetical protein AXFE_35160 [Acidithrix ferrooxidans]|uniref:Uncharacterized protein n=1 Tax=Acidithrix ferrooxidans TaxID=1280514 RepID=A0A0D8HCN0_9ACTN|nr:hypothetical protein AXFE_35160 [Acidithrix ferrooxidans]